MGGHSLGGHLSSVFSALFPEKIDGIVHIACSFPFKGAYPGRTGRQIGLLCNLIPLFGLFWGYYPGKLVGFGGNEYLGVMQDWRMWARSGCFDTADFKDINQKMSNFTGQVVSIRMDQDDYATDQGLELAVSGFTAAKVDRVQLTEEHQGKYLGHFNWAKKPKGVAQSISDWISKTGEEQG
ncbi:hypothetical protein GCM10017044_21730 [Kordiimonas sediminis]|uniref:Uncharacterized protein n=2 Tax=Kordiimonas sediminis TaxID=1735581 RepID=A0A919AW62_9PROT|nr:hypothetical protein GCM10017044_21730 [Kordiimonas sediminis]